VVFHRQSVLGWNNLPRNCGVVNTEETLK
jgi:hypothetical protein